MIAPDTTHIQTERPQRRTTSLIYPLPISVFGLMVPFRQNLYPVAQESYSIRHVKGLNITFLPRRVNFIQLHRRDHSPTSCLWMVPPTSLHFPFMSLAVFTNSQSFFTLLNSASNLLTPNATWTIWSFIAAYLIWPNCPSVGSMAIATYVPMRSRTC